MFKNLSHDTQNQYWQSKEATSGTSCRKYMPLEQLGQRWFITSNLWAVPSSDYFWCNFSCDSSLFACLSVSLCVWLRNWSRQHTRAQEWVVWWQIQQKQIAENLRSRWWIVWWRTTSDISNVYVWCWTISTQSMFTAPGASAGYKYKAIRTAWPTKSLQTIRLESGIHKVTYIMLHT